MTVAAATLGVKHLQDRRRAAQYFTEARVAVEEHYSGSSLNGMRLDLPFRVAGGVRSTQPGEGMTRAEMLFHRALTLDEDMPEARLGLAAVYLQSGRFAQAREEFGRILVRHGGHLQALIGRAAAYYEEALSEQDPLRHQTLLHSSLADCNRALQAEPQSAEARYNRIWTLYELGRHREALEESERYLEQDATSIWSARVRELRRRMALSAPEAYKEEVRRAAAARDPASLITLVQLVPDVIPAAIRHALQGSLDAGEASGPSGTGADYRWAASTMEGAYRAATGDNAYERLIDYVDRLTPRQRETKRELDKRFQELLELHRKGEAAAVPAATGPVAVAFERLYDFWQLVNVHHLRGNCRFYQADFAGHSESIHGAPALILRRGSEAHRMESGAIQSWNLARNRLVVLAGCETGTGPLAAGESPWGLAPAFFKAGVPALVLSLLPLEEAALRQHLEDCPACLERLASYLELVGRPAASLKVM